MVMPVVGPSPFPEEDPARPARLGSAVAMVGLLFAGMSDSVDVTWRRSCGFCITRRFDAADVVGRVDAVVGPEVSNP